MKKVLAATLAGAVAGAAISYGILDRGLTNAGSNGQEVVRDLGNVPRMSKAAAEQHRADRYAKLYSIQQILALPSDFARTEALYALAGRSDSGSAQNLIYEANRIADPLDRAAALNVLVARLTEIDPESALAMARSPAFFEARDAETVVWRSWGKHDLRGALQAARSQATSGKRNLAAQALFSAFGYLGNEKTDIIENELGIRPDRRARARYLYDLADRSPAEAIKYIEALKVSTDRRQSVSWLAYHLGRTDPDRAGSYSILFTDTLLRQDYDVYVARSLAAADPKAVLDSLLHSYGSQIERSQVYSAMRELVARDLQSAQLYFEQVRGSENREAFGYLIAEALAREDPQRAIEWAREDESGERFLAVLPHIAVSDPQLAIQESKNIVRRDRRTDAIANIAAVVARDDPALAAQFVDRLADRRDRDGAAATVFRLWAQDDPDAAVRWLNTSDDLDAAEILRRVGSRLMRSDIDTAMRVLPQLDEASAVSWRRQIAENLVTQRSAAEAQTFISQFENSDDYYQLQAAVVGGVAHTDIVMARQLAEQLPVGEVKDTVYVRLISRRATTHPAEASAWLQSISDQRQRTYATGRLMTSWYSQDPEAANRWADNLPVGAQRDDAIVSLAGSWQDASPSQQRLINSIADADKKVQAQVAQVNLIARRDWQRAQSMLDDLSMSAMERERTQRSIDYYRNR